MLGGVGLGNMWTNTLGIVAILAFNTALQSQCSQANGRYQAHKKGGRKKEAEQSKYLIGIYYQRGLCVLSAVLLLMTLLMLLTYPLMVLIGVPQLIINYSIGYTIARFPGIWLYGYYDATKNYINSQNLIYAPMFIQIITLTFHMIFCWIMFSKLGYTDFKITAYSKDLVSLFNFLLIVLYIKCCKPNEINGSWIPWNWTQAFSDWGGYLKVALPIAFSFYMEGVMFETYTVLASLFKDTYQLAVHVAMGNTSTFFFYIGLGFNISTTIHVGTSVGNKYVQKTKNLIYCGLISMTVLTMIEEGILITFQQQWARLFTTTDQKLIEMELSLLQVFLILLVSDNYQHIFQGSLKSLHYERAMLWTYFLIYYPISLPITLWLAFWKKWYTMGLWVGFTGAVTIVIIIFAIYLCRLDYKEQIQSVRRKLKSETRNASMCMNVELKHKEQPD